jgi:hypothetical protein
MHQFEAPSRCRQVRSSYDGQFLDRHQAPPAESTRPKLDHPRGIRTILIFSRWCGSRALLRRLWHLQDYFGCGDHNRQHIAFLLLGAALLTALGFELAIGFHDTARGRNILYAHSLVPPAGVSVLDLRSARRPKLSQRDGSRQRIALAARSPPDPSVFFGRRGPMAAYDSGVQVLTLRSLALAWVLTLPCARLFGSPPFVTA